MGVWVAWIGCVGVRRRGSQVIRWWQFIDIGPRVPFRLCFVSQLFSCYGRYKCRLFGRSIPHIGVLLVVSITFLFLVGWCRLWICIWLWRNFPTSVWIANSIWLMSFRMTFWAHVTVQSLNVFSSFGWIKRIQVQFSDDDFVITLVRVWHHGLVCYLCCWGDFFFFSD